MARLLELDASIPFVRAVFAAADDEREIDSAIAVLLAAERRHGVRVIFDDVCGSLADTWVPQPGAPASVAEFLTLLRRAPVGSNDELAWQEFREVRDAQYRTGGDDMYDEAALLGFLDETSMILGGTDFANDHWIATRGGVLSSWTQRAWGAQLERWLQRTPTRPWCRGPRLDKVDLTYYLHNFVHDYERWVATCLEIIRRKCQRQLDAPLEPERSGEGP